MNLILGGGGLSSRLMESIRVEKGLAYSVFRIFLAHKHPGTFQIVLQTRNASVNKAIELAVDEMKRIHQDLVSEEELETAKLPDRQLYALCSRGALCGERSNLFYCP